MNILHFKYAVEIAKTKSISKAAENLYMGQPNLSRAVRELEEYLGVTLFKRNSKGVTVTPEGEEFLRYARRIIAQVEKVEEKYLGEKGKKSRFSVCVPRAGYICDAFAAFCEKQGADGAYEIFYHETNAMKAIESVSEGESSLGIIRYQSNFEKYFKSLFVEKRLNIELIAEFPCVLLMNKKNRLAAEKRIEPPELEGMTEIAYPDSYVPSMANIDVKKTELSPHAGRHIFTFERGSQLELLSRLDDSFMSSSPLPRDLLEKYGLVQKEYAAGKKVYHDVLIFRRGYKFTEADSAFTAKINEAKKKHFG